MSLEQDRKALRWVVGLLTLATIAVFAPFWAPLLLAAWAALIAWPLQRRVTRGIHHRNTAAALLTVLLALTFLIPAAVSVVSLFEAATVLAQRLLASKSGVDALKALSQGAAGHDLDFGRIDVKRALELAQRYGTNALGAARTLFGAAAAITLALVIFMSSFYAFLVDGKRIGDWLMERTPLSAPHFHRFANVFAEVGRGLLVGVGLTALAQGAVATIGYVVTGVPQALVLGLVTVFASLIPSVGSGLVWVPVTAGLWLSGRTGAAITMLVIGLIVSVVDNVLRPLLARYAALRLNGLVLFIAMLGGLVLFGGSGILLGPLVVRCAIEGLQMLREERAEREARTPSPGPA